MNLDLWNFKLDAAEMEALDTLNRAETNQNTMVGWLREWDPDHY